MALTTVARYLDDRGRTYPTAERDGTIPIARFAQAGLPAVVACSTCAMTMALSPECLVDEVGRVYCSPDCAGEPDPRQEAADALLDMEWEARLAGEL